MSKENDSTNSSTMDTTSHVLAIRFRMNIS